MKNPSVLLVNPQICSPRSVRLPLSLLALGAVLEGRHPYQIVDGNLDPDLRRRVLARLAETTHALVGMTVMPGPQVATAVALSRAIRAAHPSVPIVWGGYFPTLYPDAAINASYVDYLVRGQGEDTLLELLDRIADAGPPASPSSAREPSALADVAGLTWKADGGRIVHGPARSFRPPETYPQLPYQRLEHIERYFRPSFLGQRTGVYQATVGCRYRCSFCGVVSMWNGTTHLGTARRLAAELTMQRDRYGATALQLFDHNFFDREETSLPLIEALAGVGLPWWCYARADTLAGFSSATWEQIRRSRLRMAYIGAEAASDDVLRRMRKGSRVEHTLEVAERCRENGVIPEFSFVLGGPEDAEGEVEKTFRFIRRLKRVHPECEVILYFYTPTPQRKPSARRDASGRADASARDPAASQLPTMPSSAGVVDLPTTPEEWTEKRWIDFVCHRDAPWLTPRIRRRVHDFACVLGCRFPTIQDAGLPAWGRAMLRSLAAWRWAGRVYDNPRELRWAAERLRLRVPQEESL